MRLMVYKMQALILLPVVPVLIFYGLSDTIKVGRVSGMEEIVDITQQVESVVTI